MPRRFYDGNDNDDSYYISFDKNYTKRIITIILLMPLLAFLTSVTFCAIYVNKHDNFQRTSILIGYGNQTCIDTKIEHYQYLNSTCVMVFNCQKEAPNLINVYPPYINDDNTCVTSNKNSPFAAAVMVLLVSSIVFFVIHSLITVKVFCYDS